MSIFADTCFWVALLSDRDPRHELAIDLYRQHAPHGLVTSEDVLAETLTYFAGHGPFMRRNASELAIRCLKSRQVVVVHRPAEDFSAAVLRYGNRLDKGFSFTDCQSMLLMERRGIRKVLSHDHHFTQAGFEILM